MKRFKAQQTTTASRETIWNIWKDVSNWPRWNTQLYGANLNGDFVEGATGQIHPKTSSRSKLVITELTGGESFTYQMDVPMARLYTKHYFADADQTTFVHEIWFEGLMGRFFSMVLGGAYTETLPESLQRIRNIAETGQPEIIP